MDKGITTPAERSAEAYCRLIDGNDYGSKDGHDPKELAQIITREFAPMVEACREALNLSWHRLMENECKCGLCINCEARTTTRKALQLLKSK